MKLVSEPTPSGGEKYGGNFNQRSAHSQGIGKRKNAGFLAFWLFETKTKDPPPSVASANLNATRPEVILDLNSIEELDHQDRAWPTS